MVRNLTNYGAFIEIEEGIDGLLHVSDMSWVRKVSQPDRGGAEGPEGHLRRAQRRSGAQAGRAGPQADGQRPVGRRHPRPVQAGPEGQAARSRSSPTSACSSNWKPGLEGLLHISELSDDKVESPEEVVKVGDEVEVKVLRVDAKDRKIGLSHAERGRPDGAGRRSRTCRSKAPEAEQATEEKAKAARRKTRSREGKLRGGTGAAGPLFQLPGEGGEKESDESGER